MMIDRNQWLQQSADRLAANGYGSLAPEIYGASNFRYAARRSRFELSKFGNAEHFFTFAEIPNLTPEILRAFSGAAFRMAMANKAVGLPCGLFEGVFSFAVAITAYLSPPLAQSVRQTQPPAHWAAFELPVVFDLADGTLHYFERTPLWGAAYYAGFRREIEANLR